MRSHGMRGFSYIFCLLTQFNQTSSLHPSSLRLRLTVCLFCYTFPPFDNMFDLRIACIRISTGHFEWKNSEWQLNREKDGERERKSRNSDESERYTSNDDAKSLVKWRRRRRMSGRAHIRKKQTCGWRELLDSNIYCFSFHFASQFSLSLLLTSLFLFCFCFGFFCCWCLPLCFRFMCSSQSNK